MTCANTLNNHLSAEPCPHSAAKTSNPAPSPHGEQAGFSRIQGVTMTITRMRPVNDVALVVDRPHWTVRTWARRGRVPHEYRNGHLYVDLVATAALSEQTPRRNRASAAA